MDKHKNTNNQFEKTLRVAIKAAKYEEVVKLIQQMDNVNIPLYKSSETPLMLAARINITSDILEALIKAGADVNATDKHGRTALMYAAENNNATNVLRSLYVWRGIMVFGNGCYIGNRTASLARIRIDA